MLRLTLLIRILGALSAINLAKCSIDGISYTDTTNMRTGLNLYSQGEDPCNPLYWYPRNIPEFCQYRKFPIPAKPALPALPMPLPVPIPPVPPLIMPMPALPFPVPGLTPVSYGPSIIPSNLMLPPVSSPITLPDSSPYLSNPYTNPQLTGMVPGLPGVVTQDGGINILPFSDAYTDLIEKHKNKMIRRRLDKLIKEYEDFPNRQSYKRLRKYARRSL